MSASQNQLRLGLCFVILLGTLSTLFAKPHTPAAGSAERKAILNALRVPIQQEARQQIVFYDVELKVENGWAWVSAISMDKAGKKMPLGDLATQGLLHKVNGHWRVMHWGVSGDVSVVCAAVKNFPQAPRAIFGSTLSVCH